MDKIDMGVRVKPQKRVEKSTQSIDEIEVVQGTDTTKKILSAANILSQETPANCEYRVGSVYYIPIDKLRIGISIRNSATEKEKEKLIADIKENGITHPIHINKDFVVVDGACRLCIAEEIGIVAIPALIIDLAEKDFALYQWRTHVKATNTGEELINALQMHLKFYPEQAHSEIARQFGVQTQHIVRLTQLLTIAPKKLLKQIQERKISQTACLGVVDLLKKQEEVRGSKLPIDKAKEELRILSHCVEKEYEDYKKEYPKGDFQQWSETKAKKLYIPPKPRQEQNFDILAVLKKCLENSDARRYPSGLLTVQFDIDSDEYRLMRKTLELTEETIFLPVKSNKAQAEKTTQKDTNPNIPDFVGTDESIPNENESEINIPDFEIPPTPENIPFPTEPTKENLPLSPSTQHEFELVSQQSTLLERLMYSNGTKNEDEEITTLIEQSALLSGDDIEDIYLPF